MKNNYVMVFKYGCDTTQLPNPPVMTFKKQHMVVKYTVMLLRLYFLILK
jgi:hypothetical protein